MTLRQESESAGAWLLAAISNAEAAQHPREPRVWAAGHVFDAVVVADRLGVEAVDWYRRLGTEAPPCAIDHYARKVAFLIAPVGEPFFAGVLTVLRGDLPYRYLSTGGYLIVPGPGVETGDRYQWLNKPAEESILDRDSVAMLAGHLLIASRNLSAAAEGTDDAG
ncbi:hypothetical protein [Streptomyces sp. SID3343]|uniref:hypothetical protein n=1 Tax=Streptomyces sp. SID3343 TaxID=2690260 RepID=UPI00137031BB|nr:hypothetical protein [Streptomyces sp. SID3343]MYW01475.1 hypothetical protein [Streptomyces sp. SID3343]